MADSTLETLARSPSVKFGYDYVLKFLLVGDFDSGKDELLSGLADGEPRRNLGFADTTSSVDHKIFILNLDGRKVKLQLWNTSGQGRFEAIYKNYSRGAQGILLVYDITNKTSFQSIEGWVKEVDKYAPTTPKILIGNRLHLAFKRQVSEKQAQQYSLKNGMKFFEVSSLCDFNVVESLAELSRLALSHSAIDGGNCGSQMLTLEELCCLTLVRYTTFYGIDRLEIPNSLKVKLKATAITRRSQPQVQHIKSRGRRSRISLPSLLSSSSSSSGSPRKSRSETNCVIS